MPAFHTRRRHAPRSVASSRAASCPELFGRVNDAARLVLSRAGWGGRRAGSAGLLRRARAHAGDRGFARGLAERNVDAFAPCSKGSTRSSSPPPAAAPRSASPPALSATAPGASRPASATCSSSSTRWRHVELADSERACYDDPCHLVHA
ncbi:MAG: hypothetical protein R3E53_15480 [Myxococcota bacterium]